MEQQKREHEVGAVVHFVDSVGVPHKALVTAWWSETCCNLVLVSGDEEKQDNYGRQIERQTSVMHKLSAGAVYGNHWKWLDEELTPVTSPMAV